MSWRESNRLRWARWVVTELEALDAEGFRRLSGRRNFHALALEWLRCRCLADFWYHLRFAVYPRTMHHFYEPLHGNGGLAGALQDWRVERYGEFVPCSVQAVIMSREHVKTQEVSVGYTSWCYAQDEDTTGLGRAYTDEKIKEIGGALLEVLSSEPFQRMYPHVGPKLKDNGQVDLFRADRFRLERRTKGLRTPSWEGCGMGKDPTGGHFNFRLYDDFEVGANARSEAGRADMVQKWKDDASLMLGGGRTLLVGTPWHKEGLIFQAMTGTGLFEGMDYKLFQAPCKRRVFAMPFEGHEPILDGDRMTIRDGSASFPTIEENLVQCEARVQFFNPATADTVEEVREVVSNTGTSFTVGRPFPQLLGQPLGYRVGAFKPTAPNRFTFDAVDLPPPEGQEHCVLTRQSLHKKKLELGSADFSAQWDLEPVDDSAIVLNPEFIKWVDALPDGPKKWYRCNDYATAGRTKAATAESIGCRHASGTYLVLLKNVPEMDVLEKLLSLFYGELWVRREHKARLEYTTFEKAQIEKTVGEMLPTVERMGPYEFFRKMTGKYSGLYKKHYPQLAEEYFKEAGTVHIPRHILSRGNDAGKTLRIQQSIQPELEAGRLHILTTAGHREQVTEYFREFRLESKERLDLLDTMADLVRQPGPSQGRTAPPPTNAWEQAQREARASVGRERVLGGGGWRGW